MKNLIEDIKLQQQCKLPSGNWETKSDKVKGTLTHGCRVKWYYEDDKKFAEEMNLIARKAAPYAGLIISIPDKEFRCGGLGAELDIEDCVVIIDDYPTEKCGPSCEWVALGRILDDDNLVELFVE